MQYRVDYSPEFLRDLDEIWMRMMIPLLICLLALSGCAAQSTGKEGGSMAKSSYTQIDQETTREMMLRDDGHVIADVRRQDEYDDKKTIYLAGGCFWGVQKFFDQFDGVISTEVGYANGPDTAPGYQEVCASSGHAETVKIVYDENRISLTDLLGYYFMVIDPLSVNRQGNDRGIQYRTGIYYTEENQLPEIEAVYRAQEEKAGAKLAVELLPLVNFFTAEEYHQKYLDKNPGGYCHIPRNMFTL